MSRVTRTLGRQRTGLAVRRLFWIALLGVVTGCAQAPAPSATQGGAPPDAGRATPPPPPWTVDQQAHARALLDASFASPVLADAGLVVLAADATPLFARNAQRPMIPASTLKLVVAATALDALGPQHRFDTSFVAVQPPEADGTIPGSLWLVGSGDPLLGHDDLRAGVAVLGRAGIRRITDGLIVDATAFSGPEQNPAWDPADLPYDYAAGTSAISLDEDVAEFRVVPGVPGEAARVEVRPPNTAVDFTGSITTASAGADSDVSILRDPPTGGAPSDRNDFQIGGRIAAGEAQSFYKPIVGIASYAGGAVAAMLEERGIVLEGGVRTGAAPFAARTLWLHRSQPLAALLHQMLVFSDNHTAEQLLRIVGFEQGHAGTERAGIRAERAYLARNDIPLHGVSVFDGSGLSPKNRVPPLVVARVLRAALRSPGGDAYLRALPLVGREGTVKHHDLTAALGRARAKSGHIDGVNALAGTVQTRGHGRVTFAFVVNGPYADADVITKETDRALDVLAAL
jgi:serine-type D-Ala-D-Ala carboxypeptidase/endopeptidase (penicillin-binding protein 4)